MRFFAYLAVLRSLLDQVAQNDTKTSPETPHLSVLSDTGPGGAAALMHPTQGPPWASLVLTHGLLYPLIGADGRCAAIRANVLRPYAPDVYIQCTNLQLTAVD